jgi:hypothetical protein
MSPVIAETFSPMSSPHLMLSTRLVSNLGNEHSTLSSPHAYQGASNSASTKGISNLMTVATTPFDLATFLPHSVLAGAGSPLPNDWPRLPVRFEYGPSAIVKMRKQPLTIGAME